MKSQGYCTRALVRPACARCRVCFGSRAHALQAPGRSGGSPGRQAMNTRNRELAGLVALCMALSALAGSMLAGHAGASSRRDASPRPASPARPALPRVAMAPVAAGLTPAGRLAIRPGAATPKLSLPSAPPARHRVAAKRRPIPVSVYSRGPLPPLLPPLSGSVVVGEPAARPAPPTLRLTGIVGGAEKLAVLRRGEKRFMVRAGDTVEAYRVTGVSNRSVTLQRGSQTRTLRLVG